MHFHFICPSLEFICSMPQSEGKVFNNFKGSPSIENETKGIVETAKATDIEGFSDVEGTEVKELKEMTNEGLEVLVTQANSESRDSEKDKAPLTYKKLNKL
ncbi:hypothetical protein AVEN_30656-1 [Araneus ventricosus]|uniref:Uncharacterized protein n=1 Tax=Araneus ventricosus TaxID=182803 RepID=A0A4Y2MEU6_ARAVE|nr:hypothetical protein AVEN_211588-1 [Araneus ventricosus]GBN24186.1 hypothetical protein AVEN_30656-1 [Araneus ventricosus]